MTVHLILSNTLSHWRCTFNILKFSIFFFLIHIFLFIKLLYVILSLKFGLKYLIYLLLILNVMLEELNEKEQLLNTSDFNFLSNNVKELQSSQKRLKLFQFFKNKIIPKGILFLQETYFSKVTKIIWSDEFNGDLFFTHGKTNSCSLLVRF